MNVYRKRLSDVDYQIRQHLPTRACLAPASLLESAYFSQAR